MKNLIYTKLEYPSIDEDYYYNQNYNEELINNKRYNCICCILFINFIKNLFK